MSRPPPFSLTKGQSLTIRSTPRCPHSGTPYGFGRGSSAPISLGLALRPSSPQCRSRKALFATSATITRCLPLRLRPIVGRGRTRFTNHVERISIGLSGNTGQLAGHGIHTSSSLALLNSRSKGRFSRVAGRAPTVITRTGVGLGAPFSLRGFGLRGDSVYTWTFLRQLPNAGSSSIEACLSRMRRQIPCRPTSIGSTHSEAVDDNLVSDTGTYRVKTAAKLPEVTRTNLGLCVTFLKECSRRHDPLPACAFGQAR